MSLLTVCALEYFTDNTMGGIKVKWNYTHLSGKKRHKREKNIMTHAEIKRKGTG